MWTVLRHPELQPWLDETTKGRVKAVTRELAENGPGLGRPTVDSIKQSRHKNMKELRTGTLRILFAFDPDRQAILLVGGDKRSRWQQWYREAIPLADDRFDQWLAAKKRDEKGKR